MKRSILTGAIAVVLTACSAAAHATVLFDVTSVQNLDASGTGTATGTSNGVGWTLSPTFIWSALTWTNGGYTGFSDGARFNPPLALSDTLHVSVETFDLTFQKTIQSALIYISDNPSPPTDGRLDFGMAPVYISGDVNISGTTFWAGSSAGGLVRLDNIGSSVLSNTVAGTGGLTMAVVVTVPEPSGLLVLGASTGVTILRRRRVGTTA